MKKVLRHVKYQQERVTHKLGWSVRVGRRKQCGEIDPSKGGEDSMLGRELLRVDLRTLAGRSPSVSRQRRRPHAPTPL